MGNLDKVEGQWEEFSFLLAEFEVPMERLNGETEQALHRAAHK